MVRTGPDPDSQDLEAEQIAQDSDAVKDGWERTVQDVRRMQADRASKGYETLHIPAGDVAPVAPQDGNSDRYGLSYLIPGNKIEEFTALYERGEFTEFEVYQAATGNSVFIVTECIDPVDDVAIFISGAYQIIQAPQLVRAATKRGTMFTHVRELDGTIIATFEHDDVSAFFPNPDEFYAYE